MPHAAAVIKDIAAFVESKNTPGSGKRYAAKLKAAIIKLAIPNVNYSICNFERFAILSYSCTHYHDWVIAFKVQENKLVVHEIAHGSLLD